MGALLNTHIGRFLVAASLLGAAPRSLPAQAGSVKVDPAWLTVNTAKSTVGFRLVAGLSGANGGMNFDGATKGGLTLTVPLKWQVTLHFENNDPNLPHSVEVTPFTAPPPAMPGKPAFAGAVSKNASQGVGADSKEDIRFAADQAGSYMIICAVPGHAAAGMWIRLTVSATATRPEVEVSPPAP